MSRLSVLVVEDEASFADALTIGLEREGFDVTVLVDGPSALEQWEEIDLDEFRELFAGSAVRRTGFDGFKRNIRIALRNADSRNGDASAEPS